MTEDESGGLRPQYQTYARQKCFVAYSEQAHWSVDLLAACEEVLSQPEYNLEVDYARKHFVTDIPLRQKALELIANARYGIYDLSYWRQDERSPWQMPRNVMIELGIAIALNRPILLLRHTSNRELPLPEGLQCVNGQILEFSGTATLTKVLAKHLSQWINTTPETAWLTRYCIFGGRDCAYREAHPRAEQLGKKDLNCTIADGADACRPDFRSVVEEVLGRHTDLMYTYLDSLSLKEGYGFLLCSHCQVTRSSPFAIYRVTSNTPAEAFVSIGISLAIETQFKYKIPKILITENLQDIPSLLSGYEVFVAKSDKERKTYLKEFMPSMLAKVREAAWKPRPLPFSENHAQLDSLTELQPDKNVSPGMDIDMFWSLIEVTKRESRGDKNLQIELLEQHLSNLSANEIIGFERVFHSIHHYSHRTYLWDAATLIMGFCSDDTFEDFRAWLIAQGKETFHNALKNPDTLADVIEASNRKSCTLEPLLYVASNVYETKTGESSPEDVYNYLTESSKLVPTYELTSPDFPRLVQKFSQEKGLNSSSHKNHQGKIRIYELSRELNLDNKDLLTICEQLNISVKSHSTAISDAEAELIRTAAEKYTANPPSPDKFTAPHHGASIYAAEVKTKTVAPVQKKQQILEIRKPGDRLNELLQSPSEKLVPSPKESTTIYIRNLRKDATEQDLRELFSTYGGVQQILFQSDNLGRRRDFAFVEVNLDFPVDTAIKALNGVEVRGRKLVVRKVS